MSTIIVESVTWFVVDVNDLTKEDPDWRPCKLKGKQCIPHNLANTRGRIGLVCLHGTITVVSVWRVWSDCY